MIEDQFHEKEVSKGNRVREVNVVNEVSKEGRGKKETKVSADL